MTKDFNASDYESPFEKGTLNCQLYRIPAIYTLNDGSVVAAADMRYNHGSDSPNNIDTLVATSKNGYGNWQYNIINYFDDYADDLTEPASASFIDSAIGQSKKTGRVFIVTDCYPSGGGVLTCKKGSGYIKINDKDYLALSKRGDNNQKYYVSDFKNGFAEILNINDNGKTDYFVDEEYNIYSNGKPAQMKQVGSNKNINQNVFYKNADFTVMCTTYLWLRYSDDNCKTWSKPVILNPFVKLEKDGFIGAAPGRMTTVEYNGHERIIFMVYDHDKAGNEDVFTVYSDDNGVTWKRGKKVSHSFAVGKTSECQIVKVNNGVLRMFCRNRGDYVAFCDSTDGGFSWTKAHCIEALTARGNCMLSFINTSKTVDGKPVILGSYASNQNERADGVISVGVLNDNNTIDWISKYHVNDKFFAYSCLTELSDGNFAYLYEDEPAHISYMILSLDESGRLTEINGNNIVFNKNQSEKAVMSFFKNLKNKLNKIFNLM
ncbi:MAG: glycoside hydrolase [Acetobacter sp.]|nr:glycoside hydrolase [Bacteroides sp.]MCM1340669.1 glycoside hydrolase [Acetobacter sp.]MCM1433780.1 glycoside hydrolase [Clostridiales bacterium]